MKEYDTISLTIIFFDKDNVFCDASMEDMQSGGDVIIDEDDLWG